MEDGVVNRKYSPGPTRDIIIVLIIPLSLRQTILARNHDTPSAGHQGVERTVESPKGSLLGQYGQRCRAALSRMHKVSTG